MKKILITITILILSLNVFGKVDLATLPTRDTVQLTIYNSADLTLVREARPLTLKEGENKLQFSWENTLIDPTSLEMLPKSNAADIFISDLTFPPRVRNLGLWNINSDVSGSIPVEITYLTSGLSWRAFYMGTLADDEKTMRLQGYVRVTNNSGEDYENAQTRLIVGKVHMIDRISALAGRQHPYGSPTEGVPPTPMPMMESMTRGRGQIMKAVAARASKPKEITKEGLSEYFLYTIEGQETIENGWSKRLPSFEAGQVPVVNLYKYDDQKYRGGVYRCLSFKNDKDHKLGETPIPGGILKVYRNVDADQHLSYEGQSSFKYIPVDEDVELNLGHVTNVVVEPKQMSFKTENYRFNDRKDITGWDEVRDIKIEVRNTRDVDVKIEIKQHFNTNYWKLKNSGDYGDYEKEDANTVKYTITLEPNTRQSFEYNLRTYHGVREEDWRP